jgi:hypothetical protein
VWHASAMPLPGLSMAPGALRKLCLNALDGVGDASLGEWNECGKAYHVRRRLSEAEEAVVGPAIDLRGTPEAYDRLIARMDDIPRPMRPFALEEIRK